MFNSKNIDPIINDIKSVLEVIAEQHSVQFNFSGITWKSESFRIGVTCLAPNDSGEFVDPTAQAYINAAESGFVGKLKPLGTKFTFRGEQFEIVGLKPRSPMYPLLAKSMKNGKRYKFNIDQATI